MYKKILRREIEILLIKPPALVGAFYYFNSLNNPINQPPIPGTIEHNEY